MPTNDQLAGNFGACGKDCETPIRDPLGGLFPNNQIPISRFDPASLKLANDYLPRAGGDGLVFFSGGAINDDRNEGVAKGDYMLSDKDRISGRISIQKFRAEARHRLEILNH